MLNSSLIENYYFLFLTVWISKERSYTDKCPKRPRRYPGYPWISMIIQGYPRYPAISAGSKFPDDREILFAYDHPSGPPQPLSGQGTSRRSACHRCGNLWHLCPPDRLLTVQKQQLLASSGPPLVALHCDGSRTCPPRPGRLRRASARDVPSLLQGPMVA